MCHQPFNQLPLDSMEQITLLTPHVPKPCCGFSRTLRMVSQSISPRILTEQLSYATQIALASSTPILLETCGETLNIVPLIGRVHLLSPWLDLGCSSGLRVQGSPCFIWLLLRASSFLPLGSPYLRSHNHRNCILGCHPLDILCLAYSSGSCRLR